MAENTCDYCRQKFEPFRTYSKRHIYCGKECSKKAHQQKQVQRRRQCNLQARLGLSGGAIGQINEAVVAIDLVKRGWQVYTAFEPTHPFDILAIKNGVQLKIEVKTETVLPSGHKYVAMKKNQHEKHDILAKVQSLGEQISYVPELPT